MTWMLIQSNIYRSFSNDYTVIIQLCIFAVKALREAQADDVDPNLRLVELKRKLEHTASAFTIIYLLHSIQSNNERRKKSCVF